VELILGVAAHSDRCATQHFQFTPFRSTLMSGFFEAMHTVDRKTTAGGEFAISHRLR
jgi:hypothetical protein